MRASPWLPVMAVVCSVTCARDRPTPEASSLKPAHARALVDSVRAFALAIATDVTREGPGAWQGHFARSPAFFMAAEGRVVFPSSDAATHGIEELRRVIRHIELRGEAVEETGYFTGLAEHGVDGWRLRDAHWSVVGAPAPVR